MTMTVTAAPAHAYRWPDYDDEVAWRKLRTAAFMKEKKFKKAYGADGRGLIPYLIKPDGKPRFHSIALEYRGGTVRAARAGLITIDLDNPKATGGGLRRIYQPPSLNAVLSMGGIAEEAGAAAFTMPGRAWFDAAALDGVEHDGAAKVAKMRSLSGRCNAALMAELYRGVTPSEAPLYAVQRAMPISIRHRCGWIVDPAIDYEFRARGAQLIDQFPLAALQWSRIQQAATARGAKLRELADEWGFARSTAKIPPAALSAINYRLDIDGRDEEATAEELAALDNALCDALPAGAFRGKQVIDLAVLASARGLSPADASAFGRWAAPHVAKLGKESELPDASRVSLADYRAAPPEALAEAGGFAAWHDAMTLRGALDAAREFTAALAAARSPATPGAPLWEPPAWAIGDPPPPAKGRGWFPVFLSSREMLRWGGASFHNCAASYADACATGRSAIYAVLRRPIKGDKPTLIIDLPEYGPVVRGAMLELQRTPAGKCRRAQLTGLANAPAVTLPPSLTDAVRRWIAERNDPRNNNPLGV